MISVKITGLDGFAEHVFEKIRDRVMQALLGRFYEAPAAPETDDAQAAQAAGADPAKPADATTGPGA